jgi:hypothetical protein
MKLVRNQLTRVAVHFVHDPLVQKIKHNAFVPTKATAQGKQKLFSDQLKNMFQF